MKSNGCENEQNVFHDGLMLTRGQLLKVCRMISIITKMPMTISKASQPFGFINVLVGYQMKTSSVLYNFYYQHLKVELQI